MAEDLLVPKNASRKEYYEALMPQMAGLIQGETDFVANVANLMAALKEIPGFYWVGCYFVKNDQLVLGPFQGPVACTRISKGRGVCGTAWETAETIIVPDVEEFPGHIACSAKSKSEIVVPIIKDERVIGVLDVDSTEWNDFSALDAHHLEEVCRWIADLAL